MTDHEDSETRIYKLVNDEQLSRLVDLNSHEAALAEVSAILDLISLGDNAASLESIFVLTVDLYEGRYKGYRACNTEYHDLHHTVDVLLAMARLIHGAVINETSFTDRQIAMASIAALAHDVGYLQEESDQEGSGAKYTATHVRRSMDLLERHSADYSLSEEEVSICQMMILSTDLAVDISGISFPSPETELLGKMLASADLLAQMADRAYLEKLLFLYHEFREANVGGYEDELDLLRRTIGFYDFISDRLEAMNVDTNRFLVSHFASRWGIEENLYGKAIQRQQEYLEHILKHPDADPIAYLKRDHIVERVREKHGIGSKLNDPDSQG